MNITSLNASNQNYTLIEDSRQDQDQKTIVAVVFLVFSVIGVVGNITVFWFLCFKIQRNKYTVYIVNLSATDALLDSVAIMALIINIYIFQGPNPQFKGEASLNLALTILYYAMIYIGMYLLTSISTERCISVLFPIWNTVHRPRNLSTIMCCFAWALGSLESLLDNFVCGPEPWNEWKFNCLHIGVMNFVLAVGICLPLMIISSLILLIKIRKTFRQRYPPKLYIIIIVAAIMFTLSVLPLNTIRFLILCKLIPAKFLPISTVTPSEYWMIVNSALNPIIYVLIGRRWGQMTCFSIKDTLHRAFTLETTE
ncbi:mas-related G-protein coupled receptor member D-like [Pyxicephalus adspersus]|uniref:G-protein coupled receptors family 1 profile domain-containing protein n=1 Tax=Pyxicephalus adspersus TaxID=30357 RepID=A0AAV3A955_PYXAD|nr:TPA: hypothetical protein GDO54_016643 [Pyxicephalus adspersus]